jgi:hypothetical protein
MRAGVGDLDAIYNLNSVAGFIWQMLDGHTSVCQIVNAVCAEFDVSPEQADADVSQFLQTLVTSGVAQAASRDN